MTVVVNYLDILISLVAAVLVGFVWYGPLFGKKWMALSGIKMPDQKPGFSVMLKPIIISLVGAFLMSYTLAHSLAFGNAFLGTSGIGNGLQAAFWNWLGFIVPVNLSFVAWEGRPWALFFIHSMYWLVLLAIMGIVMSV